MKKIISIVLMFSLIILLTGCGNRSTAMSDKKAKVIENNKTQILNNENDLTVKVKNNVISKNSKVVLSSDSVADFVKIYTSVDELIDAEPPIIIFGEIADLNYTNLEYGVYTNLSVVVKESLKGELKVNDVITVFENGGITSYKEYVECYGKDLVKKDFTTTIEEPKEDDLVVSHFAGTEFSKKGQKVVMFLTKSKGDILPRGSYACIGAYMGKLTLEKDGFVHTKSRNNSSDFYTDSKEELKRDKLLSKIRNHKKK